VLLTHQWAALGGIRFLDNVRWCIIRVMVLFMVTSFIAFAGIASYRWKGGFEFDLCISFVRLYE
jgi:hypothetical protein